MLIPVPAPLGVRHLYLCDPNTNAVGARVVGHCDFSTWCMAHVDLCVALLFALCAPFRVPSLLANKSLPTSHRQTDK